MSGNAFAKIAWKLEHTRGSAGSGSKSADISIKVTDRQTDGRTDGHKQGSSRRPPLGRTREHLLRNAGLMPTYTHYHDKPPSYPYIHRIVERLTKSIAHDFLTARSRGKLWTLSSMYSLISA